MKKRIVSAFGLILMVAAFAKADPIGPPSSAPYDPSTVILSTAGLQANKKFHVSSATVDNLYTSTITANRITIGGVAISTSIQSGTSVYPATGTITASKGINTTTMTASGLISGSSLTLTGSFVGKTVTGTTATFSGTITGSNLTGTNTGNVALSTTTNGLSLAGQTLTLINAAATSTGSLRAVDFTTFNNKLATNGNGSSLTGLTKTQVGLSNVQNLDQRDATNITSGTVATARLGSGSATSSKYLRGDQSWQLLNSTAAGLGNVTNDKQIKVSDYTQKGGLLVGTAPTAFTVLAPGANNKYLRTNSGVAAGVEWSDQSNGNFTQGIVATSGTFTTSGNDATVTIQNTSSFSGPGTGTLYVVNKNVNVSPLTLEVQSPSSLVSVDFRVDGTSKGNLYFGDLGTFITNQSGGNDAVFALLATTNKWEARNLFSSNDMIFNFNSASNDGSFTWSPVSNKFTTPNNWSFTGSSITVNNVIGSTGSFTYSNATLANSTTLTSSSATLTRAIIPFVTITTGTITAATISSATISALSVPVGTFTLVAITTANIARANITNGVLTTAVISSATISSATITSLLVTVSTGSYFYGANGSAGSPTYSLTNDANSGMYRASANSIGWSIAGTNRMTLGSSALTVAYPLLPDASSTRDLGSTSVNWSHLYLGSGTASSPSVSLATTTNTGIFSAAPNQITFTSSGTTRMSIDPTSIQSTVQLQSANGSLAAPTYSFTSDPDTGLFRSASNDVIVVTGGTAAMDLSDTQVSVEPGRQFIIPSGKRLLLDGSGSGDTYLVESVANSMLLTAGGTGIATFTASGATLLGTNTNDNAKPTNYGAQISTYGSIVTAATSGTYGNVVSTTIIAGDWDCSALGSVESTNTVTRDIVCISLFSGNTTTDHVNGDNCMDALLPTASSNGGQTIPSWRVSTASTISVYLKERVTYSGAPVLLDGRLSCRRAR